MLQILALELSSQGSIMKAGCNSEIPVEHIFVRYKAWYKGDPWAQDVKTHYHAATPR